jgi:hypothetical protein
MKVALMLAALVFGALLTNVYARTKPAYQAATVVSVTNREPPSNYLGNPTDAPLRPQVYSYDVGIRLDCTIYVVRYDTGLDYLPSVFSPHQTVEVSLERHAMAVNVPGSGELSLGIVSRSHVNESSCVTNR